MNIEQLLEIRKGLIEQIDIIDNHILNTDIDWKKLVDIGHSSLAVRAYRKKNICTYSDSLKAIRQYENESRQQYWLMLQE